MDDCRTSPLQQDDLLSSSLSFFFLSPFFDTRSEQGENGILRLCRDRHGCSDRAPSPSLPLSLFNFSFMGSTNRNGYIGLVFPPPPCRRLRWLPSYAHLSLHSPNLFFFFFPQSLDLKRWHAGHVSNGSVIAQFLLPPRFIYFKFFPLRQLEDYTIR